MYISAHRFSSAMQIESIILIHSVAHKLIVFTINELKNINTAGLQ